MRKYILRWRFFGYGSAVWFLLYILWQICITNIAPSYYASRNCSARWRLLIRPVGENVRKIICFIVNQISIKFVPKGWIDNKTALVQIMAWPQTGDKQLCEQWWPSLLTHTYVTRPQRIKNIRPSWVDQSTSLNTSCSPYYRRIWYYVSNPETNHSNFDRVFLFPVNCGG